MTRPDGVSRRHLNKAGLLLASSLAMPGLLAQTNKRKLERTRIVMAVGSKASLGYLPLTISEQLGYFKAEGLDL